ncbi:hypothetical protein [Aestuariirhabdus sp. LZHN29]|uniref:hypothetical protein n=1 Tax=Aestuariirhabdus sp. LZHN29 TaxID=3417462 RepID=UPI003CF5EE2C
MKEHGSYRMEALGRVIECDCSGSWNVETAQRYCRQQRALVRQMGEGSWVKILDLCGWELGTPEVLIPLRELYVWSAQHGQVRQLNIRHQSLFKTMHLESVIPADSPIEFIEVDSWAQARELLARDYLAPEQVSSSLE